MYKLFTLILILTLSSCATVTVDVARGCVTTEDMWGLQYVCGLEFRKKVK